MPTIMCRQCCYFAKVSTPAQCPACGSERLVTHPELLDLDIAHVDCDAFYASVEKRDDPSLDDRPLIIGHAGGRGVVTTACYLARLSGARSAMPMFKALELCPDAVVMPPDMAKYKSVSQQIRAIFRDATPVIEPLSLDEAYLDLTPEKRAEPDQPATAHLATIAQRVHDEVGVTVSVGLSFNKFLAKLASDLDKPDGFSVIGRAEARDFLARLPVRKMHGVGAATAQRLEAAGIATVADIQARPEDELVALLGRFGRRLKHFAHAEDDRSVSTSRASKSISAETTFSQDISDAARLSEIADRLCERVAAQLVRGNVSGGTLVLKLKTQDFRTLTRNRQLPHPTQRADVMLAHASDLIRREADGRLFRLIGVGVSDIRSAAEADPPDLFGSEPN